MGRGATMDLRTVTGSRDTQLKSTLAAEYKIEPYRDIILREKELHLWVEMEKQESQEGAKGRGHVRHHLAECTGNI